jgi:hypothetical protein
MLALPQPKHRLRLSPFAASLERSSLVQTYPTARRVLLIFFVTILLNLMCSLTILYAGRASAGTCKDNQLNMFN